MIQKNRVALVAGASGIVGQQLCQALADNHWQVRALTHRAAAAGSGMEAFRVDLRDTKSAARIWAGSKPRHGRAVPVCRALNSTPHS